MIMRKLYIFAIAIWASGCVTYDTFTEPLSNQPHAILRFEKADGYWSSRPWPELLNGVKPASTHRRTFRIRAGPMRLQVANDMEADWLLGAPGPNHRCDMTFEALTGTIYAVSMIGENDSRLFVVTADAKTEVAKCRSIRPDPIDRLMNRLDSSDVWKHGEFPRLDLPATATADQLISQLLAQETFKGSHVEKYEILMTRYRFIPFDSEDSYMVILVDTNLGRKIVLFTYRSSEVGWWNRVFDPIPPI